MKVFVLFLDEDMVIGVFDSLEKLQDYYRIVYGKEADHYQECDLNPSGEVERNRRDSEQRGRDERNAARRLRRANGTPLPEDKVVNDIEDMMYRWTSSR